MDGSSDHRHCWLLSASSNSDGGGRINNREGGQAGEIGGGSSEIFDYKAEPGGIIL